MEQKTKSFLKENFRLSQSVIDLFSEAEGRVGHVFKRIDSVRAYNQYKVIRAMQINRLSESCFFGSTGYGYGDKGREVLDALYADVFNAEDALVRQQITTGTQALALCLFGNLRPGDELVSITGKPYDTLDEVIGTRGEGSGSLKEFGVSYRQLELLPDGRIDLEAIRGFLSPRTRMVLIQRSRGYSLRPSLDIESIREAVKRVKEVNSDIIVLVDNCYGEFVEEEEPIDAGADLAAGSLIKNPGGGLAPTGGYIAGKSEYVRRAAFRLTAPGLGKEVGASLDVNRLFFQGLFLAPHVVGESLKGAVLCAEIMSRLGFEVSPSAEDRRSDIIQAVVFKNPECLIAFCQGIQKGSPVDSHAVPQPWDMPGYDNPVIMAAGAFIQGSSIELSADAPIRPPYAAYLQGGLTYDHVRLGLMLAVQDMLDKGCLKAAPFFG